jgi:heme A synthase
MLTTGFAVALVLWMAWFVTHLPFVNIPEQAVVGALVTIWALSLGVVGMLVGRSQAWKIGLGAGLVSALVGTLVLGSRLTQKSAAAHEAMQSATLKPNALLIAGGFLALGAVLGLVATSLGARMRNRNANEPPELWHARFALVCACCAAPLIFIGGLVTSTNSGMAVPDWPNSFGTSMFLYPLGPGMQTGGIEEPRKIFFEHSHRLFGTLVGLASLVLMVWTLLAKHATGKLKALAVGVFLLVVAQGVLGGLRVMMGDKSSALDNRVFAMAHGVLGQLTLGALVAFAVLAHPHFRAWVEARAGGARLDFAKGRMLRLLATATLHATILQLLLGAAFRHYRHLHILMTHIALSLVVVIAGLMAGFLAMQVGKDNNGTARTGLPLLLSRLGLALAILVTVQFTLGWAAFLAGGTKSIEAQNSAQALLRTVHQANGAALLGVLVAVFLMVRALVPKRV